MISLQRKVGINFQRNTKFPAAASSLPAKLNLALNALNLVTDAEKEADSTINNVNNFVTALKNKLRIKMDRRT